MTNSNSIDSDLVDKVVQLIPLNTWPIVRTAIIGTLVDSMPSDVVKRLTGKLNDFDKAEEILIDYYQHDERNTNLIEDAFQILGEETVMYLLDSLQLQKI
jgi:hypothetical protein